MRRGFTLIEIMVALAIVGVLVALALPSFGSSTCKAAESEAKLALHGVKTLQADYYARFGRYADVKTSCPKPKAGQKTVTHCMVAESKGAATYRVTGTGNATKYSVTAVGLTGTRSVGSLWKIDQSGAITDVAKICGKAP